MSEKKVRRMNEHATTAVIGLDTALAEIEKLQGLLCEEFGRGALIDFTSDIEMLQRTRAKVDAMKTATADPAEVKHE